MIDLLQLETLCRCATISAATSTRGFLVCADANAIDYDPEDFAGNAPGNLRRDLLRHTLIPTCTSCTMPVKKAHLRTPIPFLDPWDDIRNPKPNLEPAPENPKSPTSSEPEPQSLRLRPIINMAVGMLTNATPSAPFLYNYSDTLLIVQLNPKP